MTETTRKLASIKQITEIRPIPDADAIECAIVGGGWPVVVKKGEFTVGNLALYLEIDSWVPHELAPFLSKGKEPREYNGVKGERLKTVKLRGQVSQGLLLPISLKLNLDFSYHVTAFERGLQEGDDLTEFLGVQKWEAPIPACLAGQVRGNFPSWIPKTDQERCQNLAKEIFQDHVDEGYEITIKLDGSSCTIYVKDGVVGVCSRNLDLKESDTNSFWKAARDQGILDALITFYEKTGRNIALQGELIGEGIQGNQERVKGQRFFLFDVFDIDAQSHLKPSPRFDLLENELVPLGADVTHVPILEHCYGLRQSFANVESLLSFADGPSLNPEVKREGVVFKSCDSDFTFKAISNQWLLKTGK